MPVHEVRNSLRQLSSSTPRSLLRKKLRGYDGKTSSRSRLHSHSSGALLRFVVLLARISIFASFEGKRNTISWPRLDMQEEAVHVNARLVRMSGLGS
jgi:hypothetical protein